MYMRVRYGNESIINLKFFIYCYFVRYDLISDIFYVILLLGFEVFLLGFMLWISGFMVFILYRYK